MRKLTAREANQSFSKILAEVEKGETILITKNGKTVAELRPRAHDPRKDPEWRKAYERLLKLMRDTPVTGYRLGKITQEDKYGDAADRAADDQGDARQQYPSLLRAGTGNRKRRPRAPDDQGSSS